MKELVSKKEAWAFANKQLTDETRDPKKFNKQHYGKVELSNLLDFIYNKKVEPTEES